MSEADLAKNTSASDGKAEIPVCIHCGNKMNKWSTPSLSNWETDWFWVCFDDECPYFIKGWSWMEAQFSVHSSYRYRIDPTSGEQGPLPVWSKDAMKNSIIEDTNDE
ncbi:ogr/Delta-like zinc finger family protein [Calditrichota bacterium]